MTKEDRRVLKSFIAIKKFFIKERSKLDAEIERLQKKITAMQKGETP